ncbi:MAG: hypothetical protein ACRCZH_06205, partial [Cetobacterium sp.]
VGEKELKSKGTQYVKSNAVQGNVNNTALVAPIPSMTDLSNEFDGIYSGILNQAYKIGMSIKKVNESVEEENELLRVNSEIMKLRNEFTSTFNKPENINFNSDVWVQSRQEADIKLRDMENEILRTSNLNDRVIDKYSLKSNEYHEEKELEFDFKRSQHIKDTNIENYIKSINDSFVLIGESGSRAEQKAYFNNIETAKNALVKYDINPTKVDEIILKGAKDLIRLNNSRHLTDIFKGVRWENFQEKEAEAIATIQTNAQTVLSLLSGVESFKDTDSAKVAEALLNESLDEAQQYIGNKRETALYSYERRQEIEQRKREAAADRAERAVEKAENKRIEDEKKRAALEKKIKDENYKIQKMKKDGDFEGFLKYTRGEYYSTDENLEKLDVQREAYGTDVIEIGNKNNPNVINVVSDQDIGELRSSMTGKPKALAIEEDIIPYAEEKSKGVPQHKTAILKDLSKRFNIDTTILLNYEEKPELAEVRETVMTGSKKYEAPVRIEKKNLLGKPAASTKKYNELLEIMGGGSLAKRQLDTFLYGEVEKNKATNERVKTVLGAKGSSEAIRVLIEDDDYYDTLKQNVKNLRYYQQNKRDYRKIELHPESIKPLINNQEEGEGGDSLAD